MQTSQRDDLKGSTEIQIVHPAEKTIPKLDAKMQVLSALEFGSKISSPTKRDVINELPNMDASFSEENPTRRRNTSTLFITPKKGTKSNIPFEPSPTIIKDIRYVSKSPINTSRASSEICGSPFSSGPSLKYMQRDDSLAKIKWKNPYQKDLLALQKSRIDTSIESRRVLSRMSSVDHQKSGFRKTDAKLSAQKIQVAYVIFKENSIKKILEMVSSLSGKKA